MSQEFENEHPRDDDGQFEKKDGGGSRNTTEREECDKPKTYRQNASYPEIIAADRAERERAAQLGGGGGIGKKQYDDWVTFVDKVLELTDKYDLWDYSDEDEEG